MTNATDTLAVGGPANGKVWCLNRNNIQFPPNIDTQVMRVGEITHVTYTPRHWWNEADQRWYWIATSDEYPVTDDDIALLVSLRFFNPAWDLRDKPAPVVEEDYDE